MFCGIAYRVPLLRPLRFFEPRGEVSGPNDTVAFAFAGLAGDAADSNPAIVPNRSGEGFEASNPAILPVGSSADGAAGLCSIVQNVGGRS